MKNEESNPIRYDLYTDCYYIRLTFIGLPYTKLFDTADDAVDWVICNKQMGVNSSSKQDDSQIEYRLQIRIELQGLKRSLVSKRENVLKRKRDKLSENIRKSKFTGILMCFSGILLLGISLGAGMLVIASMVGMPGVLSSIISLIFGIELLKQGKRYLSIKPFYYTDDFVGSDHVLYLRSFETDNFLSLIHI